jgi:hypothetical protein
VDQEADYLLIPEDYAAWLGGLHWSRAGDAIEDETQATFALAPQVALFLEGFAGTVPHFAHVLHLLHLLGLGTRRQRPHEAAELAETFRRLGRPLRNAGALCAYLCLGIPRPRPADMKRVCGMLWSSSLMAEVVTRWSLRTAFHLETSLEEAPLRPAAFESFFLSRLAQLSPFALHHWLQHTTPPDGEAAETLAEAIPPPKPRTLGEILDELAERERLGGALPYVAQMVSALSLPPRRRDHSELPIGGYADVTTRGHPETLLPSQFAVEDLEFVRRFAQNELLYFRREEPTSQIREELSLLLDQGVRTWGTVRLLLAAAALAFGRLAQRRKLPLSIAGTSNGGVPLSVADVNIDALRALVDASDLSLNPGLALERALDAPSTGLRDIVLLTHPRTLLEPDLLAAARRADRDTRVFALTVNDRGQVQLCELRRGVPVALAQFAVDLSVKPASAPVVTCVRGPLAPDTWSGDVERIGFPFRFGIVSPIEKFALDHEGKHLLTVSQNGLLHLWAIDGSRMEVLPRPIMDGEKLNRLDALLGVAGGFVLVYREAPHSRLAHYDLAQRRCTILPRFKHIAGCAWHYRPQQHTVVLRDSNGTCHGMDLASGVIFLAGDKPSAETDRAWRACDATKIMRHVRPWIPVSTLSQSPGIDGTVAALANLDPSTGALSVRGADHIWDTFVLLENGTPSLLGRTLLTAQLAGGVLAVAVRGASADVLYAFRQDGQPRGHFSIKEHNYLLSADGRYLARQSAPNQVIVHEIMRSPAPVFVTAKGRCHQDLYLEQGHRKLLVQIGNWAHLARWDRGDLELFHAQGARETLLKKHVGVEDTFPGKATRISAMSYDSARFRYAVRGDVDVMVDVFGQISVLDRAGTLVAMFFVFRNQIAAWLPDGTRYGPASVIGGPSTEGALERIGKALREASRRGQEVNA